MIHINACVLDNAAGENLTSSRMVKYMLLNMSTIAYAVTIPRSFVLVFEVRKVELNTNLYVDMCNC